MDETGEYYAQQNNSVREKHMSSDFTHMWNLRNLTEDHCGREGRGGRVQTKMEANLCIKRLLNTESKLRVDWAGLNG